MKRLSVLLTSALLLAGCAPAMNITPEVRRQAAAISIVTPEQIGDRKYSILAEVSGHSCARQVGSDPSMDAAREDLKIKAAQMGADAVASVLCKEGQISWTRNCWKTIECRGDAIRWLTA